MSTTDKIVFKVFGASWQTSAAAFVFAAMVVAEVGRQFGFSQEDAHAAADHLTVVFRSVEALAIIWLGRKSRQTDVSSEDEKMLQRSIKTPHRY